MALIKGKQLAASSIALSKLETQTSQHILVGDASGDLQSVALSGDATIANSGAITISDNAIAASKIAAGAVTFAKLSGDAVSTDLSVSAGADELARADAVKAYSDARYTAATQYADSVAQGLDVKDSVRLATTAALTLASDLENGDTLDGVALATGDRVLVKDQADATENGIYVVAASGAPSRAADADQGDLTGGMFVFVEEGTANADNGFVCTVNGTPTLGTDDIVFAQFSGAGSVSAGAGLTKTGNQLDVQVDDSGIEISADTLQLKDGGVATAKIADSAITASKISASLPGAGLDGGAGTQLYLHLFGLAGSTVDVATDSIAFVDAGTAGTPTRRTSIADFATALAGSGVLATNGQLTAARLSSGDQFEAASATAADGATSGVSIAATPSGMVQVFVNGVMAELKGDKTADCYFSADGGSTARALTAIAANDILYWNGSVAGYELEATDKITLVYETA